MDAEEVEGGGLIKRREQIPVPDPSSTALRPEEEVEAGEVKIAEMASAGSEERERRQCE